MRLAWEADAYADNAPDILWRAFLASYDTEQFTQARTWCDRGQRRFPDQYRFWECKARELTMPAVTPDADLAWWFLERTVELTPEPYQREQKHRMMFVVAEVLAMADLPDSARAVLRQARADPDVDPNRDFPYLEARVRTVLGEYDQAVELLRPNVAEPSAEDEEAGRDWATYWWWRDLRGHPGFEALVAASR